LKTYGEIPAGKSELKVLLYPFYKIYPFKVWSKYRWWKNSKLKEKLPSLNRQNRWITVIDRLGAPGDALITANVIRCIKKKYPTLKINCITPHPELVQLDPSIDSFNQRETFYSFDSTYWELIVRKEKKENIVSHNMKILRIDDYVYQSQFHLAKEERDWAKSHLIDLQKPIVAICSKSKESVKNWPFQNWAILLKELCNKFTIIQLGDHLEPKFDGVIRFAGKHTMRESAAILSHCSFFIGPDSLLMHIANGLQVKSIIIFGGSRPDSCFGYEENLNLSSSPACSPCWIHDGYERCTENMKCMKSISPEQVLDEVENIFKNN
jgi:ADP-heptose:LPS heptosyltransferase